MSTFDIEFSIYTKYSDLISSCWHCCSFSLLFFFCILNVFGLPFNLVFSQPTASNGIFFAFIVCFFQLSELSRKKKHRQDYVKRICKLFVDVMWFGIQAGRNVLRWIYLKRRHSEVDCIYLQTIYITLFDNRKEIKFCFLISKVLNRNCNGTLRGKNEINQCKHLGW